ncbi:hypothetical protein C2W58_00268 [Bacillus pumilus]|nr:hypothetical protein C2W58_00268 [Bacillus pumilus]
MYVILSTQIEQKREFRRLKCSHATYDHSGYSHRKNQEKKTSMSAKLIAVYYAYF